MPHSSLISKPGIALVSVLSLIPRYSYATSTTSSASYALQTSYAGSNFFSGFDFFTDADPTHGFVTYVDQTTAQRSGLILAVDGSPVQIGVDSTNTYNGNANYYGVNGVGRPSVRITSKQKFNHGLFIADILNMPGGVCGTWPALWTLGDGTWPYHGEIDILEGVNSQSQTLTSLHTGNQCSISASSPETGIVQGTNCQYDVSTGNNAVGCGILDSSSSSFGSGFNANGGGVYAMEWTSSAIKTWFFPRNAIPADINSGKPNPTNWGTAHANFQGNCNIDANFINHQIVLDNTFCGDWAGSVWGDSCQASTGVSSCSVYVGSNPSAFKNVFWSINSIKVYQQSNSSATSTTSTTTTKSSTTSTTKLSTTTTTTTTTMTTTKAPTTTTTTTKAPTSTTTTTTKTTSKVATPTTTTRFSTTTSKVSTSIKTTTPAKSSTTTTRKRFAFHRREVGNETDQPRTHRRRNGRRRIDDANDIE